MRQSWPNCDRPSRSGATTFLAWPRWDRGLRDAIASCSSPAARRAGVLRRCARRQFAGPDRPRPRHRRDRQERVAARGGPPCGSDRGFDTVWLDGRDLPPFPDEVEAALHAVTEASPALVLFDSYEMISSLDSHLRDTVIPQLPDTTVVVFASRQPPSRGLVRARLGRARAHGRARRSGGRRRDAAPAGPRRRRRRHRRRDRASQPRLAAGARGRGRDRPGGIDRRPRRPSDRRRGRSRPLPHPQRGVLGAGHDAGTARGRARRRRSAGQLQVAGDAVLQRAAGVGCHAALARRRGGAGADPRPRPGRRGGTQAQHRRPSPPPSGGGAQHGLSTELQHLVVDPNVRWGFASDVGNRYRIDRVRDGDADRIGAILDAVGVSEWWEITKVFFTDHPECCGVARDASGRVGGYFIAVSPASAPRGGGARSAARPVAALRPRRARTPPAPSCGARRST